jgi:Transposase DDE domain
LESEICTDEAGLRGEHVYEGNVPFACDKNTTVSALSYIPVGGEPVPRRAPVERTFALLKRWYGYRRVRYRSLVRNALQLQLLALALTA